MTAAERRRDRAAEAARLRAAGWSLRTIGRRLGAAESTIRADLRSAPVPLRPSPLAPPWRGGWQAEAIRLRAAGHPDHRASQAMPFWMIARELAVAERDVRRHFARLRKRDVRAAEAAALRSSGLSLRAVAARLGVSEVTVRRDLAPAPVVRHSAARKTSIRPASRSGIAHLDDAPNVVPLRRAR